MKVQVNDAEHSQKELVVEIPYEVFKEAADKELDALLPKAKIHGFRTGKAPREVFVRVKHLGKWLENNFLTK